MSLYDFRKRSDAAMFFDDTPSCTKQDFKDACDINNILKKYTRNGNNPFVITEDARFGDFADLPTYQEALNLINDASVAFDALPAEVRKRFDNDPANYLNFFSDESNFDEAASLGLVDPKVIASREAARAASNVSKKASEKASEAPKEP